MPAPLPPADPNVKLPGSVAKQVAASDALHAQAYAGDAPQPEPAAVVPAPEPMPQPEPQPAPPPAPQPEPQRPAPTGRDAPAASDLTPDEWRHRYLSMEGRYKQTATSLGAMQEQMSELGDELMRAQDALQRRAPRSPAAPVRSAAPVGLTPEEIQAYGPELVDVIQRAARAAVMPDIQNVHTGVQQVQQRIQSVSTNSMHATLDEQVPEWRSINLDERFKHWCNLPDVYSGQLRGNLLKAAFSAGQAARVVAFFKGFLADEGQATSQLPDPNAPQPVIPPRVPTIPLDTLTAPGRVKPAPGDATQGAPADKPIFTRSQITAFYSAVRQGAFAGRESDKVATEQAIFLAQKEGRVR